MALTDLYVTLMIRVKESDLWAHCHDLYAKPRLGKFKGASVFQNLSTAEIYMMWMRENFPQLQFEFVKRDAVAHEYTDDE